MSDRHRAGLRRRVLLLALLSTMALAAAALFEVERRRHQAPPVADAAGPRALSAPLFTPRRVPSAWGGLLARARFQADLKSTDLGEPPLEVCVQVRSVGSSDVLFGFNPDLAPIPASTIKLLTGGAALEQLGADYRFTTTAVAASPLSGGTIQGPLYLVGGGDPLLSTPGYAAWEEGLRRGVVCPGCDNTVVPQPPRTDLTALARAIKANGVTRIAGPILGDDGFFDSERINPAWKQSYLDEKIIAPISGLTVNRNLTNWETGVGPAGLGFAADPPTTAANALRQLLADEGVTVDGPAGSGTAPAGARAVGSIRSAPLGDYVQQLEHASDNFMAENILKTLGRERGPGGSFAGGAQVVAETLTAKGIVTKGLVMADGSGLARTNQVPCALLADLLARHPTSKGLSDLVKRLPVSWESGTLRRRLPDDELKGTVRGKTGGLDGVSTLAGLIPTSDGKGELSFAVLVNGDDGDVAVAIQRRVIDQGLRFPTVSVAPAGA